ncbi:MAG TPA: hypothetical protein VNO21_06825, partial [Polyangiaceae bacterium]|nr:hypothetical protein [Polyangiaceae bacterium]
MGALFALLCTLFAFPAWALPPPPSAPPVQVLPPPAPLPEPPSVPAITLRPDVDVCLGKPVTGVDTELEGEAWGLTHLPRVTRVRIGEPFREEVARRALTELLEHGQFARGRVIVQPEVQGAPSPGCRIVVQVAVRKIIDSLRFHL